MRDRVKDDRTEGLPTIMTDRDDAGNIQSMNTFIGGVRWSGTYKRMLDEPHPNFQQLRKSGQMVIGDMTLDVASRVSGSTAITFGPYPNWGTRRIEGDLIGFLEQYANTTVLQADSRTQQLMALSIAEMYAKVEAAAISGGEIIAEIGKTVSMLRRPFGSAADLLRRMSKRQQWLLKNEPNMLVTRASAQAWLEQRYGWKPVFSDLFKILELINERDKPVNRRLVIRDKKSGSLSKTVPWTFGPGIVPGTQGASCTARFGLQIRVGSGVYVEIAPQSGPAGVAAALGLRAQDLPGLAWDLMPFSFVADWFGNVGTWLKAVMPKPQVHYLGGWTTTITERTSTFGDGKAWITVGPLGQEKTFTGALGGSVVRETRVQRGKHYGGPPLTHPVLLGSMPTTLQTIDAMSLLVKPVMNLLTKLQH